MAMSDDDLKILHEGTREERRKVLATYHKFYVLKPGQDSTPHRRWQRRVIAAVRQLLQLPKRLQDCTVLRVPHEPIRTIKTRNPDGTGSMVRLLPGRQWREGKMYAIGQGMGILSCGDEPPPPNPNRDNRLRYLVAELIDENESDDTWFDDGETDWYTNNFWIKTPAGTCGTTWGKEITPAGRIANPGWEYSSRPIKKNESATTWLEVSDYDSVSRSDYYDGHSRSPCKHMEFRFEQNTMKIWEEGCGGSLSDDLKEGGYKEVARSMGNGDDDNNDVTVTHKFAVCSMSQDLLCAEKCGP